MSKTISQLMISSVICAFLFSISSCISKKVLTTQYYKDFDYINVKGITPINQKNIAYPYVKIEIMQDSSVTATFYYNENTTYGKNYRFTNHMLMSKQKLRTRDSDCNGFTHIKYYFAPNKMITYIFCGKEDFSKKEKLYAINTEMWINEKHDFQMYSVIQNTFYKGKPPYLFTFDPWKDFDGAVFKENGSEVTGYKEYIEDGKIVNESNDYIYENGIKKTRKQSKNYTSHPFRINSIWNKLDLIQDL